MCSRVIFISHLSLALWAGTIVLGPANLQAQTISTIAGNGAASYSGDGGPAITAALNQPKGMAFDASGNMYIADQSNHRIRRVTPTGTISTFAGTGVAGYSGDGGPATNAQLNQPGAVAFDAAGNLIIADSQNRRIRKVNSSTGVITTIAGTGTEGYSGDGGPATSAMLHRAVDLAVDISGNLYFADSVDNRVRKISTNGIITTVAGTGIAGYSGEGVPATAATLRTPLGVAVDSAGNLYIADTGNHVVRRVRPSDGFIFTIAGNGKGAGTDTGSFSGDNGPANQAGLNTPEAVAVDPAGNYYIADMENYRIRKVNVSTNPPVITTIAGTGFQGFSGDGGPAIQALMNLPWTLALDAAGNLYIGDNANNNIRKITFVFGTPTVSAGGIVNNASYTLTLAAGSIASIFGFNLSDGAVCFPGICGPTFDSSGKVLPIQFGAQVIFNGSIPGAILSTPGPTQLNVQIPVELAGAASATVQVTANGKSSAPTTVSLLSFSPGLISIAGDGKGQGAILNDKDANQLGVQSLVAPVGSAPNAHPAAAGDVIEIYGTGLGAVIPPVPTGMHPPVLPQPQTLTKPTVTIGGIPATVSFSGLASCCVGLNQVNVVVPPGAPAGNAIPVVVTIGGQQSNQVTIAVQF